MSDSYDLVVVGTGIAATGVASSCREAGWRVAVIDHRPFGGTCAQRGCDPKKVLVSAVESVDAVRRKRGHGVQGGPRIDWRELIEFKRTFTAPVPEQRRNGYREAGIETWHGRARFTGRNTIEVEGRTLDARHVLIAAGAEPVGLGIPGEAHLKTHEDFLELDRLPARIVMVGGGYIAAEFSHVAARAGAHVTVLQRGERLLPHFDPDLTGWLTDKFRDIGIDVQTRSAVEAVEQTGAGFVVHASADGRKRTFEADLVLHAAGRRPDFDALDVAAAGIDTRHGRLELNAFLQSISNPAVYAAGDAANVGPPLTPVASHDAQVVANNLLHGNRDRPDYRGVPSVAFTVPPIASVGLAEADAREQGLDFRVRCQQTAGWFSARQAGETAAGFKVLVENGTDRVLGAHLLGHHAEEVVNLFALAIRTGLTADDLRGTLFAYPTAASDISSMLP